MDGPTRLHQLVVQLVHAFPQKLLQLALMIQLHELPIDPGRNIAEPRQNALPEGGVVAVQKNGSHERFDTIFQRGLGESYLADPKEVLQMELLRKVGQRIAPGESHIGAG